MAGLIIMLVIAGAAVALARRLASGVPPAAAVTAVSAGALVLIGSDDPTSSSVVLALSALALLWTAAGAWLRLCVAPDNLRPMLDPPHGTAVFFAAGAVCAGLAAAVMLGRASPLTGSPPTVTFFSWVQVVFAAAALSWVLSVALRERRHRRAVWLTEPRRLLERPTATPAADHGAAALAVATGLLAFGWPTAGFSGIGLAAAALACGGLAHRRAAAYAGDAALLLVGEVVILSAMDWCGPSCGLLLGSAACGLLFTALGALWARQLDHEGRAWTTAGRLVPATRRAAALAGLLLFASSTAKACGWLAAGLLAPALAVPVTLIAVCAAWLAIRVRVQFDLTLLTAILLTCGGALVTWSALYEPDGARVQCLVAVAAAGSLLALMVSLPLGRESPRPLLVGFAWGALPILAILLAAETGFGRATQSMFVLTAAAAVTTAMAGFAARRSTDASGRRRPPRSAIRGSTEVG